MDNVVVLGSKGFFGRNISKAFSSYCNVFCIDSDIRTPNILDHIPKIDLLINCAGKSYTTGSDENDIIDINFIACSKILEFMSIRHPNATCILFGTCYERMYFDGNITCVNPYIRSKIYLRSLVRYHYETGKTRKIYMPMVYNTTGPDQSANFIIPKLVNNIKSRKSFSVGSFDVRRSFQHVSDLVSAVEAMYRGLSPKHDPEVGYLKSYSIADCIKEIDLACNGRQTLHYCEHDGLKYFVDDRENVVISQDVSSFRPWEPIDLHPNHDDLELMGLSHRYNFSDLIKSFF